MGSFKRTAIHLITGILTVHFLVALAGVGDAASISALELIGCAQCGWQKKIRCLGRISFQNVIWLQAGGTCLIRRVDSPLQKTSSELSPQSSCPLHQELCPTQRPFTHRLYPFLHTRLAENQTGNDTDSHHKCQQQDYIVLTQREVPLTTVGLLLIRLVLAVRHAITGQAVIDTVSVSTLKVIHTSTWHIQCWWGRNIWIQQHSTISSEGGFVKCYPEIIKDFLLQEQVLSSRSCLSPRQLQLTRPSDVGRHRSWQPPLFVRQGENSPEKYIPQVVK